MKNNLSSKMKKLEDIVTTISDSSDDLDKTVNLYKQGIELAKQCYQDLQKVELQVKELVAQGEDLIEKDFQ